MVKRRLETSKKGQCQKRRKRERRKRKNEQDWLRKECKGCVSIERREGRNRKDETHVGSVSSKDQEDHVLGKEG